MLSTSSNSEPFDAMKTFLVGFSLILLGLLSAAAQSSGPVGMTYLGGQTDSGNTPVPDGTGYEIKVRLWNSCAGGILPLGTRYTGVPLRKSQGTSGGPASTQQRRTLNKTVLSCGTSITRSGDIVKLAPGTYWIEASAPGYNIEHTAALVDTTTSNIVLAGRYARSVQTATSEIRGPLVLTGTPLSFEIRDYGFSFGSGASLGNPAKIAAPEKYTEISITRIK